MNLVSASSSNNSSNTNHSVVPLPLHQEWEFNNGTAYHPDWRSCTANVSLMLTHAKNNGDKVVDLVFGSFNYKVDLEQMVQTNVQTGTSRPIRLKPQFQAAAHYHHAPSYSHGSSHASHSAMWLSQSAEATETSSASSTSALASASTTKLEKSMYEDMHPDLVDKKEHCHICLMDFHDEDDDDDDGEDKNKDKEKEESNKKRKMDEKEVIKKFGCVRLKNCHGHFFHKECIAKWFETKPKCPSCQAFYGEEIGNQPHNGVMKVQRSSSSLPGYSECGTITVVYSIPSGIQTERHPNPGAHYYGTTRYAYLPDNKEGNKVLGLLRRAFDNRVIFTVGQSLTTGQNNTVTWNGIHHKTNKHGGQNHYGYPDATYLNRVTLELAAKGIIAEEEEEGEE